jgi:hypothetical protein
MAGLLDPAATKGKGLDTANNIKTQFGDAKGTGTRDEAVGILGRPRTFEFIKQADATTAHSYDGPVDKLEFDSFRYLNDGPILGRRKLQAFAADAVIAMDFQSQTADNQSFGTLRCKTEMAILSGPCGSSMAQSSVRGACGFVLTAHPSPT